MCGCCRYFAYTSEETLESHRDRRQKNVQTGTKPAAPKPKHLALPAPPVKLAIKDLGAEEDEEDEDEDEEAEAEDEDPPREPAASSSSTSPVQELLAKLRSLSKADLRKVKKTIK